MSGFKDHFSATAAEYARFRPNYPDALFRWLAIQCRHTGVCWDVATGSGQAATGLARHFASVVATDASASQLANAEAHPAIDYRCEPAERSTLADQSVDLITVAQALHWFDLPAFFAEARRVLRPDGVIAVWCYGRFAGDAQIDSLLAHYYQHIVGPFWPPERRWLEQGYDGIDWPFADIAAPAFELAADWTLPQLLGYLGTWSASRAYQQHHGRDPRELIAARLATAWGEVGQRTIRWPLSLKVARQLPAAADATL